MKKHLITIGILVVTAAAISAFIPQQDKKEKQKEQQEQGKQKNNQGKKDDKPGKGNQDNKGQGNAKAQDNKNNAQDNKNNKDRGKDDDRKDPDGKGAGKKTVEYGYDWDRETFKDRRKIKNQAKVTVCHKFNRGDEPAVSINVSSNALKAHMDHGDVMGVCPPVSGRRWTDIFVKKREDYYNAIQDGQEQVTYSRSILDYAWERVRQAREQLAQSGSIAPADLERRQVVIVELERNATLLESLVGVAANLVASRLQ